MTDETNIDEDTGDDALEQDLRADAAEAEQFLAACTASATELEHKPTAAGITTAQLAVQLRIATALETISADLGSVLERLEALGDVIVAGIGAPSAIE